MKKLFSLILTLALILTLCACGNEKNESSSEATTDTQNTQTEADSVEIPYPDPVVVLDNEYLTITATAKFSGEVSGHGYCMGYRILIENKSDYFLMLNTKDCSLDGFMLNLQDGPWLAVNTISPQMKANTGLYFKPDRVEAVTLTSIDNLVNLNGVWQVSPFKNVDGACDPNGSFDTWDFGFDNVIP